MIPMGDTMGNMSRYLIIVINMIGSENVKIVKNELDPTARAPVKVLMWFYRLIMDGR